MLRQTATELEQRLATKTLDQAFLTQLQQEFNYSPFESRAILAAVKASYLSHWRTPEALKPGQTVMLAIKANEPPGKPLKECQFAPIIVTLHAPEDDQLRRQAGRQAVTRVRRAQLLRLAWEAVAQETYLTVEDLAYRLLNGGPRTLETDLAALRAEGHEIPLRGQQLDIGRGVTHKLQAVRLFLERKTYTQIQQQIHHSQRAIQRYVEDFVAVALLTTAAVSVSEISFLRRISPSLVREYQTLYDTYNTAVYRERLAEVLAQFSGAVALPETVKGGPTA
jgi:hypothetical protein